jgi:H+-translocating NAD(P) transhydrogenase subunit alpha
MSGSNFVHGVVLIGAIAVLATADNIATKIIGFIAVFLGAGNAMGGFIATDRMLRFFADKKKKEIK